MKTGIKLETHRKGFFVIIAYNTKIVCNTDITCYTLSTENGTNCNKVICKVKEMRNTKTLLK